MPHFPRTVPVLRNDYGFMGIFLATPPPTPRAPVIVNGYGFIEFIYT